ncbi:serine/threonine protein kinase [Streptomyces sp. NBC_00878]|uniref:serine/threonine protein kinase n=1 Tax=Streptomyces sp. NBC_00878 TaxID=2975854 RepID=UPI00224F79F1|nr:serine/threonine protein kinase [Streptomyces sp. NBC_00878]MCX4904426.1 serine/threonine protein kinase [Streptomyces sp. NBC_00878]
METIIVQLPGPSRADGEYDGRRPGLLHLGPGDLADFGRGGPGDAGPAVVLSDPGVSRRAGRLEAAEDYWRLSNFSQTAGYVVENLEGAGEYITVAPGRLAAPVPFEFSRVVLPALNGTADFKVFAPQHAYLDERSAPGAGDQTVNPFALDPTSKYFLVLVALCEPRLRAPSDTALPGAGEIAERLRPLDSCRDLSRSAVNYHIDYLAFAKLRLDHGDTEGEQNGRTGAKRAQLVAAALRFGLVREEHLALLPSRAGANRRPAQGARA